VLCRCSTSDDVCGGGLLTSALLRGIELALVDDDVIGDVISASAAVLPASVCSTCNELVNA